MCFRVLFPKKWKGQDLKSYVFPYLAQASYFTLFFQIPFLLFLIIVLVSQSPKTKHIFCLTADLKVIAFHDQTSSASHLIEMLMPGHFHISRNALHFQLNITNFCKFLLVSLFNLKKKISENPQFRFSLLEIFLSKLDFCLTKVALP